MTTITKMDKAAAKKIGDAVQKALDGLGLDGVQAKVGRGTYDPEAGIFTMKVEVGLVTNGVVATKESASYKVNADLWDCDPEWLGKSFATPDGREWKVVGLNARKHDRQILVERHGVAGTPLEGKRYWFRPEDVIAGMLRQGVKYQRSEPDWHAAAR